MPRLLVRSVFTVPYVVKSGDTQRAASGARLDGHAIFPRGDWRGQA